MGLIESNFSPTQVKPKPLPPYQCTAPGQTAPENRQTDQMTGLNAAVAYRLIQGDGTGCRRDIAVFLQGQIKSLKRNF